MRAENNLYSSTILIKRQLSKAVFVRHEVNKGHIATYNEGIDWASADYFLLLSADGYLLRGALERAASLLDAHLGFVIGRAIELRFACTSRFSYIDEPLVTQRRTNDATHQPFVRKSKYF